MVKKIRHAQLEILEGRRMLAVDVSVTPGLTFAAEVAYQPLVSGQFGPQILGAAYVDLHGDGNRDLVFGENSIKGVSVSESLGDGRFDQNLRLFETDEVIAQIIASDLNQDGVVDLVARGMSNVYMMLGIASGNGNGNGNGFGEFELKQRLAVPVRDLDLGDVDGDGHLDLVVANTQVSVYSGAGDGSFSDPIAYTTTAPNGRQAKLADVDADGDLDLVSSNDDTVTVLRNDQGIFETQIDSFSTNTFGAKFAFGDADADGVIDLWISHGSREHSSLAFHQGKGDGTFEHSPLTYDTLGLAEDIKFTDVNGDALIDVVVGHGGTFHHPINNNGPGGISILLATTTGAFHPAIRIATPDAMSIFLDDVNADGSVDIVSVHSQKVSVHRQSATSLFEQQTQALQTPFSFNNGGSAVGDFNDDQITDYALATYDNAGERTTLSLMLGTTDGSFVEKVSTFPGFPGEVHVGNFDDDAGFEIGVQTTERNRGFFSVVEIGQDGEITDPIRTQLSLNWNLQSNHDFNGDGIIDFLALASPQARVLLGSPSGNLTQGQLVARNAGYNVPLFADFNRDNVLDFAMQTETGFSVMLGAADGTFALSFSRVAQFSEIRLGDFDGDAQQDIVFTSFNDRQIHVVYGNGAGTFVNQRDFFKPENASVFVADVNVDGRSDIMFDTFEEFTVYLSNGETMERAFDSHVTSSLGEVLEFDIDNDGTHEVLLIPGFGFSISQAQLTVIDFNGEDYEVTTTSFSKSILPGVRFYDVDQDGDQDIVASSLGGIFVVKDRTNDSPSGDINADGQIDIADVDLLCSRIHTGPTDPANDLNGDGSTDLEDVDYLVKTILETEIGDVNFDGRFDSGDLVSIFQIAEYEDGVEGNSRWSEGDWNCDGDFDSSDIVHAFQSGGYSAASRSSMNAGDLNAISLRLSEASAGNGKKGTVQR